MKKPFSPKGTNAKQPLHDRVKRRRLQSQWQTYILPVYHLNHLTEGIVINCILSTCVSSMSFSMYEVMKNGSMNNSKLEVFELPGVRLD